MPFCRKGFEFQLTGGLVPENDCPLQTLIRRILSWYWPAWLCRIGFCRRRTTKSKIRNECSAFRIVLIVSYQPLKYQFGAASRMTRNSCLFPKFYPVPHSVPYHSEPPSNTDVRERTVFARMKVAPGKSFPVSSSFSRGPVKESDLLTFDEVFVKKSRDSK